MIAAKGGRASQYRLEITNSSSKTYSGFRLDYVGSLKTITVGPTRFLAEQVEEWFDYVARTGESFTIELIGRQLSVRSVVAGLQVLDTESLPTNDGRSAVRTQ